MKTYEQQENGYLKLGDTFYPHYHHAKILAEVEKGLAEIEYFDHEAYQQDLALIEENDQNRQYLVATDWYVIRNQETGAAMPQEITDARAAAREAIK